MTNGIGHRVIAISRIFLKDQWKFLPWWLLSKSEYNAFLCQLTSASLQIWLFFIPTSLSSLLTQIFAHHDHFHVYTLFGNCKITLGNPPSSLCQSSQSSNYRKVLQCDFKGGANQAKKFHTQTFKFTKVVSFESL